MTVRIPGQSPPQNTSLFPRNFSSSGQQHRWTHWVSSASQTSLFLFHRINIHFVLIMYLLKNFVIMVLSWLFLCFLCGLIIVETAPSNETWDLNSQKGIMRGQNLRLMKIQHPTNSLHTCYREECSGSHCTSQGLQLVREFCYPAILITGLPKCGTSAMYDLLTKLPGVITMHEKENCPFTRRRAHHMYFHSLPEVSQVQANSIIIDGCIDVVNNMKMRLILREPDTYYLVMIRDYADMLWSSYNFWCRSAYDRVGCGFDNWSVIGLHQRSPSLFHDLIIADRDHNMTVIQPFHYPMHRPCINAGGYFTEYIDFNLKTVPATHKLALSSEEMEVAPLKVIQRVVDFMHLNISANKIDLGNFTHIRVNAQENKGATKVTFLSQYQPGIYNISGFQPMHNSTRAILNQCWQADCQSLAQRFGYQYTACHQEGLIPTERSLGTPSQSSLFEMAYNRLMAFTREDHTATMNTAEVLKKTEQLVRAMNVAHARDRMQLPASPLDDLTTL